MKIYKDQNKKLILLDKKRRFNLTTGNLLKQQTLPAVQKQSPFPNIQGLLSAAYGEKRKF